MHSAGKNFNQLCNSLCSCKEKYHPEKNSGSTGFKPVDLCNDGANVLLNHCDMKPLGAGGHFAVQNILHCLAV